tara:strand:+ start:471 stop:701 length:231 start_codon:yes stop_codon:yes gene_type:complete
MNLDVLEKLQARQTAIVEDEKARALNREGLRPVKATNIRHRRNHGQQNMYTYTLTDAKMLASLQERMMAELHDKWN